MTAKYDYYTHTRTHGKCSACGVIAKEAPRRVVYYLFCKDSWFRGDDSFLGKFCKTCLDAKMKSLKENGCVRQE